MELLGRGQEAAIRLSTGGEIDLVSFAARDRAHAIPWFDFLHRGQKLQLRELVAELEERLIEDQASPLELSRAKSDLAIEAMRWVVQHDDFDPENTTGELRAMVAEVDSRRAA